MTGLGRMLTPAPFSWRAQCMSEVERKVGPVAALGWLALRPWKRRLRALGNWRITCAKNGWRGGAAMNALGTGSVFGRMHSP